jgi:hypothetical protein
MAWYLEVALDGDLIYGAQFETKREALAKAKEFINPGHTYTIERLETEEPEFLDYGSQWRCLRCRRFFTPGADVDKHAETCR